MALRITVPDKPSDADREAVLIPLRAHNIGQAGDPRIQPVAIMLTDENGASVGGLWGEIGYDWLFVELLAVPEAYRGQDLGTALMNQAEAIARARDCVGIWLDTYDFQARGFYEKLGFEVCGAIEDHPVGHRRFFLCKRLGHEAPPSSSHSLSGMSAVTIRVDDPGAAHVSELFDHHLRELRGTMAEFAFALDASGLSAEGVTFWTAWRGNDLAGFVALKQLDPLHGELKSMRAAPEARGTGVGRALLDHVVGTARKRGYRRLSLETGTADLHAPAISLYRSAGFASCEAFSDYRPSPHNQFLSLDLTPGLPELR